jgi:hypothetical protein
MAEKIKKNLVRLPTRSEPDWMLGLPLWTRTTRQVTIAPLNPTLGDSPEEILRNLTTEWKSVVANIETLKELVTGSRDMSREMAISVMKEFGEFDFELARLSNLLGARTAEMDPIPIFRSIGDLKRSSC